MVPEALLREMMHPSSWMLGDRDGHVFGHFHHLQNLLIQPTSLVCSSTAGDLGFPGFQNRRASLSHAGALTAPIVEALVGFFDQGLTAGLGKIRFLKRKTLFDNSQIAAFTPFQSRSGPCSKALG